ncbi:MAG: thiamine phosphate synthase [Polyangiales bacterium]
MRHDAPVRLLIITDLCVADEAATCSKLLRALAAAPGEMIAVGLRDHQVSTRRRILFARTLIPVVRRFGARLIVHDRVDIALAVGADGVQLGGPSMGAHEARALLGQDAWVGRSCHDEDELLRARSERVDSVTLSPVFSVPQKAPPLGLERFRQLRAAAPALHVLALGGVGVVNEQEVIAAGADGVACIRAVLAADDPFAAVQALTRRWD